MKRHLTSCAIRSRARLAAATSPTITAPAAARGAFRATAKTIIVVVIAAAALATVTTGCSPHRPNSATTALHVAKSPHGGIVVDAGDDYRIEFVRDADTGVLTAYILDDEMEDFIRIADKSLELEIAVDHGRHA